MELDPQVNPEDIMSREVELDPQISLQEIMRREVERIVQELCGSRGGRPGLSS